MGQFFKNYKPLPNVNKKNPEKIEESDIKKFI